MCPYTLASFSLRVFFIFAQLNFEHPAREERERENHEKVTALAFFVLRLLQLHIFR